MLKETYIMVRIIIKNVYKLFHTIKTEMLLSEIRL